MHISDVDPTHPRTEYDSHAPDWHPSLQEQAEMRRERTSLARMAAVLGLVLCIAAGWALMKRVDQIFGSSVQRPGGTAWLKQAEVPSSQLSVLDISESWRTASREKQ